MSERDSSVKAAFHAIEAAMSVVRTMGNVSPKFKLLILLQAQYGHNTRLKDDAAASLGTNHVISKIATRFVEVMDKQAMSGMGVTPSVWQSGPVKEVREERLKSRERELLDWAGIDPTAKII